MQKLGGTFSSPRFSSEVGVQDLILVNPELKREVYGRLGLERDNQSKTEAI